MTARLVVAADRVVTPDGVITDGAVAIADGRIDSIAPNRPGARRLEGCTLVPGFVDIHVHGGGGHSMTTGEPDDVDAAARFHRAHGTTTTVASFVTAPLDELSAAAGGLAAWLDTGAADGTAGRTHVAGIHYEGPFLATNRCGAQNPAYLVDPTAAAGARLIGAAGRWLRMMTIAPERPGAVELVAAVVAAGAVAAVGHTDATWEQTRAAIVAGATVATHLGNAMPPFLHRQPGPIGACLDAPEVTCELIADGHHLHDAFIGVAARAKGGDGIALITDAIAATGRPDGRYTLGGLGVEVRDGAARLVTDDGRPGSLAGSTLTMDAAFRRLVAIGVPFAVASAAASTTPARVLGLAGEIGSIAPGHRADLVVLDADWHVRAVIAGGVVVAGTLD